MRKLSAQFLITCRQVEMALSRRCTLSNPRRGNCSSAQLRNTIEMPSQPLSCLELDDSPQGLPTASNKVLIPCPITFPESRFVPETCGNGALGASREQTFGPGSFERRLVGECLLNGACKILWAGAMWMNQVTAVP